MRILIVEDQRDIATLLAEKVLSAGFQADIVATAADALTAIRARDYDVILLDRRLPDGDGVSIIQSAREARPGTRILVLTAMRAIDEKIDGLDAGADDYLTKPFDPDELMARIRAVLRRPGPQISPPLRVGALIFNTETQEGFINDRLLLAPKMELALLSALMRHAGRAVTRPALLEEIYGSDDQSLSDSLKMLIHRLRQRLKNQNAGADIHAARGIGYLIRSSDV